MVHMLGDMFVHGSCRDPVSMSTGRPVIYEHIQVSRQLLEVAGEHIMSGAEPLHVQPDFFGADEAITNYVPGRESWVATLIICAEDRPAVWEKRDGVIADIRQHLHIDMYRDPSPNRIGNTCRDTFENR